MWSRIIQVAKIGLEIIKGACHGPITGGSDVLGHSDF